MPKNTKATNFGAGSDFMSLLGVRARKASELIERVESGLPYSALETFGRTSGLTLMQVRAGIGMSERTWARRRKESRELTSEESDRLVRVSRVFSLAVDLFEGDKEAAHSWFLAPNRGLGEISPLAMVRTEIGAREVENLIGRLEHGVFS